MALVNCQECGKQISDQAKACPQCGAKYKRKSLVGKLLLLYLLVSLVISAVVIGIQRYDRDKEEKLEAARVATLTPEQRAAEAKAAAAQKKSDNEAKAELAAVYACRNFIEKSLKDPDSIKYPDGDAGSSAIIEKDGTYRARVTVRAKNSFGAVVPSVFQCRLGRVGDNWFLDGLKELPLQ